MSDQIGPVEQAQSRRQFLKRAGIAAVWTVPTVQVINMAGASAGGGPVGTSVSPPTQPAIPCDEIVLLKAVALYSPVGDDAPAWHWLEELESLDTVECIEDGEFFNPGDAIEIDGVARLIVVVTGEESLTITGEDNVVALLGSEVRDRAGPRRQSLRSLRAAQLSSCRRSTM